MKKGDVCTVVSLSCINSIVVFYALNRSGAISNYINVIASENEFQTYFTEAGAQFIVTMDLFAEKVLKAATAVTGYVDAFGADGGLYRIAMCRNRFGTGMLE